MPIIAQLAADNIQLGVWFLGLVLALNLATSAVSLVKSVRGGSEKRTVILSDNYVTREDSRLMNQAMDHRVSRLEAGMDQMSKEIRTMFKEWNEIDEKRSVDIHNRINHTMVEVSKATAAISGLQTQIEKMVPRS